MTDACGSCFFFDVPDDVIPDEGSKVAGECHVNPPMPCYAGDGDIASLYSVVNADAIPCRFYRRLEGVVQ